METVRAHKSEWESRRGWKRQLGKVTDEEEDKALEIGRSSARDVAVAKMETRRIHAHHQIVNFHPRKKASGGQTPSRECASARVRLHTT